MFPARTRLLVVDDSATMREFIKQICKNLGFVDITDAIDGEEAWANLTEASPPIELIIADWNLSISEDFELLRRVRNEDKLKHLPFIVLTSESEVHWIASAIKLGL